MLRKLLMLGGDGEEGKARYERAVRRPLRPDGSCLSLAGYKGKQEK